MSAALLNFSLNRRKTVFWLVGLLTLVMVALIPNIQIDTDPENMLPADHPERMFHNLTKQRFSMQDTIVVGLVNDGEQGIYNPRSLTALHALTEYANGIEGVVNADLMSLANVDNITQSSPGTIRFEWMMNRPPQTDAQAAVIRQHAERLPMLVNTLVSGDGKAAALYVPIADKSLSFSTAERLRAKIAELDTDDQWHITGLPVAEDQFGVEMFIQMGISAPLAGLTIFLLLFVFFRNISFITAPMIVAMATVLITMGLLIGMGFTVHIMSSMIAIFLMPIAVVDSVHVLSEFSDRYKPENDPKAVLREVMGHLFQPMLFTSITSSVGFLSLLLTPIPPVQIFGAFIGFGILLAFLLTVVFLPAYLSGLSEKTLNNLTSKLRTPEQSRLAGFLSALGHQSTRFAKAWIALFVFVFAGSLWGISHININDNPVRWFKSSHEIRIADEALNHHFAGTYDAFLVLESTNNDIDNQARALIESALQQGTTDNRSWSKSTQDSLQMLVDNDQTIEQLISELDDLSFSVDDSEASVLSDLLVQLEQLNSNSMRFLQPEVLAYIETLEVHLQNSGLVGKTNTLADIVKTVNRELRSGQAADYQLPDSAPAVAQTLLQYQSSHRPQDLWHFVTPDYRHSLLWLQLTSGDNQDMSAVVELVEDYIAANPLPPGLTYQWAGKAYLNVVWQEQMVAGMLDSLAGAFIVVLLMMVFLFRSIGYGLLAMLPLTLTISFIYGLIGWIGKDYDMPIAVLSALTLGLSVDFAIHFIERFRAHLREGADHKTAIQLMFQEPARAISRNAIVIAMGFTPLLFAPLVPYITVGVFLASIMAISALVTLVMLPSVLSITHQKRH